MVQYPSNANFSERTESESEPVAQAVSDGYLPFHDAPKVPQFVVPEGAVDAHCHVFGPQAKFPFSPERKYTPVDASKEQLFSLRDHLGFSRNVIVQATCHGSDNAALLDALRGSNGKARGVAIVDAEVTDNELTKMHEAGVRGVRLNFLKRLVAGNSIEKYRLIAQRVHELGWHVVVYFESEDLAELIPFFNQLPNTLVIDHMGRPDVRSGVEGAGFQQFVSFLNSRDNLWVKVSCPERLTIDGPPYGDAVPFAKLLVETFHDRVLWGSDWPHPNMKSHIPDDGALVDLIPKIAPTSQLQKELLVTNPMRLYWPEEVAT